MSAQDTAFNQKIGQIFNPHAEVMVMGILNCTPDSFSDGGSYVTEENWLKQSEKMIHEGADIIDIGALSTRPNAIEISEEEEGKRLIPVVSSVRKCFPNVVISVDTFRAKIAQKAVDAGANIINDISGGTFDEMMFETIAQLKVPYVLMHNNGSFERMHEKEPEHTIQDRVASFLRTQIVRLNQLGVKKIIIDPGVGFGKTMEQNYELISDFGYLEPLPYPILIGISRKSMISRLLNVQSNETVNAASGLHSHCIGAGAKIIRVHDVKPAKQVIEVMKALKRYEY